MIQKIWPLMIVVFVISACTDMHLRREQKIKNTITKDAMGTRWTDVTEGHCTVRILSFNVGHIRLALESKQNPQLPCEVGIPPLITAAATPAKALMDSYSPEKADKMQVELSLSTNPTLIKKWAAFLKQSPIWKNRPKQKSPWDESEYKLVRQLLQDGNIFESYSPLLSKFPTYPKHSLHIEKVSYETAASFPFFESDLRAMGYVPQDRIPIPLIVTLTMETQLLGFVMRRR